MRVLHVATLFSPDGAYGGPTRVATNQARALRDRGHDVTLAGAIAGYSVPPTDFDRVPFDGFPVRRLVPGNGFAGLAARGLMHHIRTVRDDLELVHVHVGRDLVTLPALRLAQQLGIPTVAQPHGMILPDGRLAAKPVDAILTRPALRGAGAVFYLTAEERNGLAGVAGTGVRLAELHNGVPAQPDIGIADGREVLFLARLHPRKRPDLFVRVAAELASRHPEATFTVAGPDGGHQAEVDAAIAEAGSDRISREGPVAPENVNARLARAFLYVLPSVNEPYPMAVLEAMATARPVIVTSSCGLADAISRLRCGIVVSDSAESLRNAIDSYLADPVRAASDGARGAAAARAEFGMGAVAERLERHYRTLTGPVGMGGDR